MKKTTTPYAQGQDRVNTYFTEQSSFWKQVYRDEDVYAEIHRERHATVLKWIDSLELVPDTRILEAGCGAGFLSIALAERGFKVHATDSIPAMVDQARLHAQEAGVSERITFAVNDIYSLPFEDGAFDLVIALGVIPWIDYPEKAIHEMARITKPNGEVILTADNRLRLNFLLDPWINPVFNPLKRGLRSTLLRGGIIKRSSTEIDSRFDRCSFIDAEVEEAGLTKIRSKTLGFGPFTLFRRTLLPNTLGKELHHRLQQLADSNVPVLRSTGSHYIVLAKK